ncbi:hypothetical protein A2U01_0091791, partial [Trifolium medium]|nr:hypothetical protein [Trifolium medium]
MPLTTGTKPRTVTKFYAPLAGVDCCSSNISLQGLRSYFHPSLRFYFVLLTRPPWSTLVLNRNTLPTMHDTEL